MEFVWDEDGSDDEVSFSQAEYGWQIGHLERIAGRQLKFRGVL